MLLTHLTFVNEHLKMIEKAPNTQSGTVGPEHLGQRMIMP